MNRIYIPTNWYWIGPLGLYSSGNGSIIADTDPNYVTWVSGGNKATPWPQDTTHTQTAEALDDVLAAAGLPATGLSAPTKTQLIVHGETAQSAVFTAGELFNVGTTDVPVNILCDGTEGTSGRLALLLAWGQANPTATDAWKDNNRVFTTLTGAQFVTLATLNGAWIKNVFAFEGEIETEINAGTITTMSQIDALVWPTS